MILESRAKRYDRLPLSKRHPYLSESEVSQAENGGFQYPPQRSQFTTLLNGSHVAPSGIQLARIQTSAGYNDTPIRQHMIGLHLGELVPILHQRAGYEQLYYFRPGDVVFASAGSDMHYAHPAIVDALYITLEPENVLQTAAQMGLPSTKVNLQDNFGKADPTIYQIGQAFLRELRTPAPGGKLYFEALATQLTVHLLRHYNRTEQPPCAQDNEAPDQRLTAQLQPVLDYVYDHLSEDISLADLAAVVHFTPYHFSRLFRRAYGISPYQYLIQQRVEKARCLLENPHLTVAEVALMVGFGDHSHLTRHYKRLMGHTPRA